jgi:hypothetical protein
LAGSSRGTAARKYAVQADVPVRQGLIFLLDISKRVFRSFEGCVLSLKPKDKTKAPAFVDEVYSIDLSISAQAKWVIFADKAGQSLKFEHLILGIS